jgi:hypothetical protein
VDLKSEENIRIFTGLYQQVFRHIPPTAEPYELGESTSTEVLIRQATSGPDARTGHDKSNAA